MIIITLLLFCWQILTKYWRKIQTFCRSSGLNLRSDVGYPSNLRPLGEVFLLWGQ